MKTLRAAIILTISLLPVAANASPILDQAFETRNRSYFIGDGSIDIQLAQTFTVGLTGTLVSLDLPVTRTDLANFPVIGDLQLYIVPTAAGIPATDFSEALSSLLIPKAAAPNWGTGAFVHFDIPSFAVQSGDVLAIVLVASDTTHTDQFEWRGARDGGYGPGSAFARTSSLPAWGSFDNVETKDLAFRTYVEPTSEVPEPASLLLLGTGLVGAVRAWRKRKV